MSEAPILVRTEGRIGVLTFNRPEVLNAFNTELIAATNAAMAAFSEDDRVLAIVVHGAGRCFSAGFDMKESAARGISGESQWRDVLQSDFDFIMQFWDCPKPTIASVHGYCIGGAFEVMMACDMAVAGESALMGEPEVRFGSAVVAMLAPFVMGPKHAKELLLTGQDRVSAQRCHEMGLLNRVVPDGGELGAAMDLAKKVANAAPRSVQLTKRAMNRTYERAAMRDALVDSLDHSIMIEADESPERSEFNRIRKEQGLKAALDWRDRSAGR